MSQKIVFMGTPEFSVPTLESLVNSNNQILAVYSQPPKKQIVVKKLPHQELKLLQKNIL